jgi:hypothetical protein
MKKILRIIALALSLALVASNSYAAVKAGSACSKAGMKNVIAGKTYTCVKSGKKLVWDKGVLIRGDKPSSIASPIPKITKASQIISVGLPPTVIYPSLAEVLPNFLISPSASSGLAVKVTTSTPKICSVASNSITPLWPGECVVQFEQDGDDRTLPADVVRKSIIMKPECTVSSRSTSSMNFDTSTCYVGTRTITSTYIFSSSFLVRTQSIYEFFNGTRREKTTSNSSMIYDYINGAWADKGLVQFSTMSWDRWESSGCTKFALSASGQKVCQEGSGFDAAVLTENATGLRSYCMKRSATDPYCFWEFDVNWIALDPNSLQIYK